MPDLGKILEILKVVQAIIEALRGMGLTVSGDVSVEEILKLIPK